MLCPNAANALPFQPPLIPNTSSLADRELPIMDAPPAEALGRAPGERTSRAQSGGLSPGLLSNNASFKRAASLRAAAPSGPDSGPSSAGDQGLGGAGAEAGQDGVRQSRTSLPRQVLLKNQFALSGPGAENRRAQSSNGAGGRGNSSSPENGPGGEDDEDTRFFQRTTAGGAAGATNNSNSPFQSRPGSAHASKRPSVAGSFGGLSPRTSTTGVAGGVGIGIASPLNQQLSASGGLLGTSHGGAGAAAAGAGWEVKPILAAKQAERPQRSSAPGTPSSHHSSGSHPTAGGPAGPTSSGRESPQQQGVGTGSGAVARQLLGDERASTPVRRAMGKASSLGPSRLAAEGLTPEQGTSTDGQRASMGGDTTMGSPGMRPGVRASASFQLTSSVALEGIKSKPGPST